MPTNVELQKAEAALAQVLLDSSGFELSTLSRNASFLELGFDSLFLIQMSQRIKRSLGVKIAFRQLIEEVSTIDLLVEYMAANGDFGQTPASVESNSVSASETAREQQPAASAQVDTATVRSEEARRLPTAAPELAAPPSPAAGPIPAVDPPRASTHATDVAGQPGAVAKSDSVPLRSSNAVRQPMVYGAPASASAVERIIMQQNQLMARHLDLLMGASFAGPSATTPDALPPPALAADREVVKPEVACEVDCDVQIAASQVMPQTQESVSAGGVVAESQKQKKNFERFGPYKPVRRAADRGLTEAQEKHLADFVQRYTSKTAKSRVHAQTFRRQFADPRGVAGYRRIWKDMVYQIVVERSKGAKLWDIDGNEYVDIAMGFGLNLFGQSPDFVTKALHEQLERGVEVGPQSPLAGEVAQLLCEFSRKDRVTFCNTGSEAVMAAMRLARTVNGKTKSVYFNKDYHGNFDQVLLRSRQVGSQHTSAPAAPGVPDWYSENTLVLDYGTDESLRIIRENADDIASILIEPVQSADPFIQPREFLQEIRKITKENQIAMIMDEVITGFRAAQGGAQEWFGVWGDMSTYGKILGGGMPIGALAGTSEYMDALDGGYWEYEGNSEPEADMTFFAGTFVRHPLAIAAAYQILMKVKEEGPDLQTRLTSRTTYLANTLNQFFEQELFPIRVAQFTSLFRFMFPPDLEFADMLYFHLLDRGIFTRGWGDNCFLSTEHSDEDVERIIHAVKESCIEIRRGGFLPHPGGNEGSAETIDLKKKVDAFALTEGQMEIWLGSQMSDLANCAYNEPFAVRMTGDLNVSALQRAIEVVFKRHDALHLQFDREPTQTFVDSPEIDVSLVDLSAESESHKEEKLNYFVGQFATLPYDLEKGPLVRFRLLQLEAQRSVLLVSAHHIVCDGWSWNVLLTEIGQAYQAFVQGSGHKWEAPASYLEYIDGLHDNGEDSKESLAYWLQQYQQLPAPLELPVDRPRLPAKSYRGATLVYEFGKTLLPAVKQAAASHKVSLFSFVFTAFNVFLSKLSGQDDIVVTVPTAGQLAFGNPNLVGHCVNLLPVRTHVDSRQSFRSQLQSTTSNLLSAYDHQHCTLGEVVKHLKIQRNASRLPLAEVNFNLERVADQADFGDLELEVSQTPKCAVNFDLFFNLCENGDGLRLDLDFAKDLFDHATMLRWVQHLERLLLSLASNTDQSIERLSLLTAEQASQVITQWNQSENEYRRVAVHQLFEEQAAKGPRSVAVKYRKTKLSYVALNRKVNQLAHYLTSQGAGPGSFVGLHVHRSERMLVAALAVLKTGAAFLPLDPNFPSERLEYMVSDAGITHLLTESQLIGSINTQTAKVVCLDGHTPEIKRMPTSNLTERCDLESPAYVLYTSGSTGHPKGVVVPHRALTNFLQAMRERPGIRAEDSLLGITTMSFDISLLEIFLPLVVGARLVIADREISADGKRLMALMAKEKITFMQATPATWQLLIYSGWEGQSNLKVLCGGEPLALDLAKELSRRCQSLWNMYGPTETTIWSSVAEVSNEPDAIDLGVPISNTTFYVLDSQLAPVPIGVAGNLFIGGDGLALGYLNREQLTREKFVGSPFDANSRIYDTGDVVRRLVDGRLEYVGRRDSQVKIRGFRIELGEIENALGRLREIAQACVVTRPVTSSDADLVAYVVSALAPVPSVAELRNKLGEMLPEYMVPKHFVFLDSLPLTPNLKIDRGRLPAPDLSIDQAVSKYVAPRTDLERRLVAAFESVLGIQQVGVDDNFFELGGHSLAAAKLLAEVEKVRGDRLPLSLLLQAPTPRLIADELGISDSIVWNSLVPIKPNGTLPPLYCIHAAGGNVLLYRSLARQLGGEQPVWGLQSDALKNGVPKARTVEEMARAYAAEIEANNPDGQIHLCGYCLGGSIAYEVAQQLTQAGRAVGLVALFDTHSNWRQEEKGSRLLQQLKFHAENLALAGVGRGFGFVGEKLQEANRRISRRIASRISQAAYYARLRSEPPIELLDQIYDRASEEYTAVPYSGRVVVFKPKQSYVGYEDKTLGWSGLVEDLQVVELPVYPAGMLVEPFVKTLADHMRTCLEEAAGSTLPQQTSRSAS